MMASPLQGQSYTINGVKVQFPCKAYPSQLSMMDKIIKGLDRNQNCLLESPTGSGKSLALLCSALAWQSAEDDKMQREEEDEKKKGCCTCGVKSPPAENGVLEESGYFNAADQMPPPNSLRTPIRTAPCPDIEDIDFKPETKKIRGLNNAQPSPMDVNTSVQGMTPDQASCVATKETCGDCMCQCDKPDSGPKRRVPKIYFGTRTHKQIAQIAKELGRTAYKHVRMTILSSREHSCIDPEVSRCSNKSEECKNKLDGPGCRYYDKVRKVSHRSIRDSGLDTAWDLEEFIGLCQRSKACPYFGARQLKEGADIVFCPYNYLIDPLVRESMEIYLKGQIVILDEAHNIEDSSRSASSFSITQVKLKEARDDLLVFIQEGIKPKEHRELCTMITSFIELIERNVDQLEGQDFDNASKVWNGMNIVAQLKHSGVGPEDLEKLKKCFAAVMDEDSVEIRHDNRIAKLKANTKQALEGLFMVLGYIYKDNMKYLEDYRVAIVRTMIYVDVETNNRWLSRRRGHREPMMSYNLHFWCLNPAVAFSDISDVVRSVILTSGTLSPLNTFQSELSAPFPIQLEANHVISRSQVWVGTISKGPRGSPLLGTYQHSETFAYQDEIGNLVLRVCQTVPHGVLCFLPSYKSLEKLCNRWKNTGLWNQLKNHKVVMTEPRASEKIDFDVLLKHFYDTIRDHEHHDSEEDGITGALFFAVCRGKVSEGMDFTDNNARAVIAVGIPYPNIKDPQLELKKQYNDMYSSKRGLLCGREWYEIQAFRAINQALGRCIRHRNDWGALILVDERYAKNPQKYIKSLSKWVRNQVQYYSTFQQAENSLKAFTKDRLENPTPANASVLCSQSPGTPQTVQVPLPQGTDTPLTYTTQYNNIPTPSLTPMSKVFNGGVLVGSASPQIQGVQIQGPVQHVVLVNTMPSPAQPNGNVPSQAGGFLVLQNSSFSETGGFVADPTRSQVVPNIQVIQPQPVAMVTQEVQPVAMFTQGDHAYSVTQTGGEQSMPGVVQALDGGDMILDFNPPLASTQLPGSTQIVRNNPPDAKKLINLLTPQTAKSQLHVATPSGSELKNPKGRLQFDTPQGKNTIVISTPADKNVSTAPNSSSKNMYKFVSLTEASKTNQTPSNVIVTSSRSNSPTLFDSDDEAISDVLKELSAHDVTTEKDCKITKDTCSSTVHVDSKSGKAQSRDKSLSSRKPLFKKIAKTPQSADSKTVKSDINAALNYNHDDSKMAITDLTNDNMTDPNVTLNSARSSRRLSRNKLPKHLEAFELDSSVTNRHNQTKIKPELDVSVTNKQNQAKIKPELDISITNGHNQTKIKTEPSWTFEPEREDVMSDVKPDIKPDVLPNVKPGIKPTIDSYKTEETQSGVEEHILNTKRMPKNKRRRSGNLRMANKRQKPGKGVNFSDDDDCEDTTTDSKTLSICCPLCRAEHGDISDFHKEPTKPAFVKAMCHSTSSRVSADLLTTSVKNLPEKGLCVMQASLGDSQLNSYWSEEDGCVIQLLGCEGCKNQPSSTKTSKANCRSSCNQAKSELSTESSTSVPCLGAHILHLSQNHNRRLQEGQVWLLPQCVKYRTPKR